MKGSIYILVQGVATYRLVVVVGWRCDGLDSGVGRGLMAQTDELGTTYRGCDSIREVFCAAVNELWVTGGRGRVVPES